MKGSFDDIDDSLQIGQQLDEGTVATGGARRTFRRRRVDMPRSTLCLSRSLEEAGEVTVVFAKRFNQVGDGQAGLGGLLAQRDAFAPWPEQEARPGRHGA